MSSIGRGRTHHEFSRRALETSDGRGHTTSTMTDVRESRTFEVAGLTVTSRDDMKFASSGGGGGGAKSSPYDPIGEAAMKLKEGQVLKVPLPEGRSITSFRLGTANSINKRFGDALKEEHGENARFRVRRSADDKAIGVFIGFKGDADDDEDGDEVESDEVEDSEDWDED